MRTEYRWEHYHFYRKQPIHLKHLPFAEDLPKMPRRSNSILLFLFVLALLALFNL